MLFGNLAHGTRTRRITLPNLNISIDRKIRLGGVLGSCSGFGGRDEWAGGKRGNGVIGGGLMG